MLSLFPEECWSEQWTRELEIARGVDWVGSSDTHGKTTTLETGKSESCVPVFPSVLSKARCPLSILSHILAFLQRESVI